jgi:DNA polymerase-3 subunit alpha
VHCAAEFYAANMTIEADNTDKLKVLLNDAKIFGIRFDPPDINRGTHRFEPIDDKTVRYGLGAVKGTGQSAIEAIVAAREGRAGEGGGPFHSLFDFCARVDRKAVNKRAVEALVKAGAFDSLHPDGHGGRAALLASVGLAFDWAETQQANALQVGLFDFGDAGDGHGSSTQEPALMAVVPWDIRERLVAEKGALGFYLSGHLFDAWKDEVRRFCRTPIADLVDSREPQLMAGIVTDPRTVNGQRGRVVIFKLDDGTESIEAVANDEIFEAQRELMAEDQLVIIQGKLQPDRFSGGLRLNVNQVWDLAAARARFGRYLAVDLNGGTPPVADVLKLWPARRVEDEHGTVLQGLGVRLRLRRTGATAELELGDDARFWPCDEALSRWRGMAHGGVAQIVYE